MSLVKQASTYNATPIVNPKREGIRIIDHMPTYKIIGYLLKKHRVGLLMASNVFLLGAMVWPKVSWII